MDGSSIDNAEVRVFSYDNESAILTDHLQTIDYSGLWQRIRNQMNKFAVGCPFFGLPDTGIVCVDYIPQNKLIELKSLKNYFISFRNVDIYQEDVTSGICNDLNLLLESEELLIKTNYSTNEGIATTCTINYNEQKS